MRTLLEEANNRIEKALAIAESQLIVQGEGLRRQQANETRVLRDELESANARLELLEADDVKAKSRRSRKRRRMSMRTSRSKRRLSMPLSRNKCLGPSSNKNVSKLDMAPKIEQAKVQTLTSEQDGARKTFSELKDII